MVVFIWGFAVATIWAYIIHEARKRRKEEEIPDVLKCALYDYKIEEVQPDNSENEIRCIFEKSACRSCEFYKGIFYKGNYGDKVLCIGYLKDIRWRRMVYPRLFCDEAKPMKLKGWGADDREEMPR